MFQLASALQISKMNFFSVSSSGSTDNCWSVKDRYQQNESLYRMMRYEKFATYLIMIFIVIIIAFNIFGSLSMLMIEKAGDIETLRSLGARNSLIRKILVRLQHRH